MKRSIGISTTISQEVEGFIGTLDIRIRNTIIKVTAVNVEVLSFDRVFIDKQPKVVECKNRIGDFEIDTVIGRHHVGALVTVVDRKSKFFIIKKVESKRVEEVTKALIGILFPLKPIAKTITSDNGKEFAYHKKYPKLLIRTSISHIHIHHGRED